MLSILKFNLFIYPGSLSLDNSSKKETFFIRGKTIEKESRMKADVFRKVRDPIVPGSISPQ